MPQIIEARSDIRVEIESLWRTFAKDFTVSWAKVLPDIVTILGDGDLGALLLLQFKSGGPTVVDDRKHRVGLEVLEGGHLSNGLTKYITYFKLSGKGESETLVDIMVVCEQVSEEADLQAKTTKFPLLFFKSPEAYLQKVEM